MISVGRPVVRNGARDCATAASNKALTSGRASTSTDGTRMNRVCLPEPSRIFFGSGSAAPRMKHRPTPLAPAAMETTASDGRSVGE
jgi:hypothetical protein